MATILNAQHCYPQSSEALFNVYASEDLIPQRYAGIGARNVRVKKCEQNGDSYTVITSREVAADIPKALAKLAGEWNTIDQEETWTAQGDGAYHCAFSVKISGLPVELKGHMLVQAEADGCSNNIEIKVSCSIPLLGKTAEKFVAGDTEKSMQLENLWIKDFLSSQD